LFAKGREGKGVSTTTRDDESVLESATTFGIMGKGRKMAKERGGSGLNV